MDGTSRTCRACQTALRPEARFCPKCGQWTGSAPPGPAPGGLEPDPRGGPGSTITAPPAATPPAADWNAPTATQTAYPARPYQAPLPPPTRSQSPYPPQPSTSQPSPRQPAPAQSYPPAYQQRPYDQRPYDQQPYEQPAYDAQGFEPFRRYEQPAGPPPGPPRRTPGRHDRPRSGWPVAVWIILLVFVLGGGAAAVILLKHPFSHPALREAASTGTGSAAPTGPSGGATPGGTASASPAAPGSGTASPAATASASAGAASTAAAAVTEQQAATNVASMLSQSGSDRSAIINAANDVAACGPNLTSDPGIFDNAASSRKALLASLATMPGGASLPPALVSDLTKAWQASIAADQAYARWANDEIAQGCVPNDTSDPGYQATETPNAEATQYKTAFTAQWNPIAAQYGLTQYQPGQL
jgi:hypothetical protein